jgi:hypothetical protein
MVTTVAIRFTFMLHRLRQRRKIPESSLTTCYERRVIVERGSIQMVAHCALSSAQDMRIWIPRLIISLKGHSEFKSIVFELHSQLTQIEPEALYRSSFQSILIPRNIEILGSGCFSYCKSLSSIIFESNSRHELTQKYFVIHCLNQL